MKKFFKGAVIFLAALFLTSLFFSCQSAPKAKRDIGVLDVLDGQAAVFLYIPVKTHERFLKSTIKSFSPKIKDGTCDLIIGRTNEVAVCVGNAIINEKKEPSLQFSAKGSYPEFALKTVFKEQKGWEKKVFNGVNGDYDYFESKNPATLELKAAFPGTFALLGNDVENEIAAFDLESSDFSENKTAPYNWDESVYKYLLSGKNNDIMFYAQDPSIAVRAFLGKNIKLGMKSIFGRFYEYSKSADNKKFGIDVYIELTDARTMKAATALLKLAIFPTAARISAFDSTHILIQDLVVDYDKLLGFFK